MSLSNGVSVIRVRRGAIHRVREGKRQPPPAPPQEGDKKGRDSFDDAQDHEFIEWRVGGLWPERIKHLIAPGKKSRLFKRTIFV
jgi:hypothetical protein